MQCWSVSFRSCPCLRDSHWTAGPAADAIRHSPSKAERAKRDSKLPASFASRTFSLRRAILQQQWTQLAARHRQLDADFFIVRHHLSVIVINLFVLAALDYATADYQQAVALLQLSRALF